MSARLLLACAVVGAAPALGAYQGTITVPETFYNWEGYGPLTIEIRIQGPVTLSALNLNLQLGGEEYGPPEARPKFLSGDLVGSGLLFEGGAQTVSLLSEQILYAGVFAPSGQTLTLGEGQAAILARVTVQPAINIMDEGYAWPLSLTSMNGPTDYAQGDDVRPILVDGFLMDVPEPTSLTLLLVGGAVGLCRCRARRV